MLACRPFDGLRANGLNRRFLKKLLVMAATFVFRNVACADDDGHYIVNLGANFTNEGLTVENAAAAQTTNGLLTSPRSVSPYLGATTPSNYFGGSEHFGYYFYASRTQGYVDRQSSATHGTSMQSRVPGTFPRVNVLHLQAGAALFASVGDTLDTEPTKGTQFKVGIGVGPAYASIHGTVPAQFMTTGMPEAINVKGYGVSMNVFVRLTVHGWFLEGGTDAVSISNSSHTYNLNGMYITSGYGFPFSL